MKILLTSPQEITYKMGYSRVLIDLAEKFRLKGHECQLIGPQDIGCTLPYNANEAYILHYSQRLYEHVKKVQSQFDIIEFDHEFFPFKRQEFSPQVLFVARTVLLVNHLEYLHFPRKNKLKTFLTSLKQKFQIHSETKKRISFANKTLQFADLINLPNNKDKDYLVSQGHSSQKIIVLPYGVSPERMNLLDSAKPIPQSKTICFLGTFDYRKGCAHFKELLHHIHQSHPETKLKLIGVKGMFQTETDIRSFFSADQQKFVEIQMTFERDQIASLFDGCSIGVFPSYVEGFPFGILEMMLAGLPVVSFDSPGADMMVDAKLRVTPGDIHQMARVIIELLNQPQNITVESQLVKQSAQKFSWERVATETLDHYQKFLLQKRQV